MTQPLPQYASSSKQQRPTLFDEPASELQEATFTSGRPPPQNGTELLNLAGDALSDLEATWRPARAPRSRDSSQRWRRSTITASAT